MSTTSHCHKRQRQRGRNDTDVNIIQKYGEYCRGIYMVTNRGIKKHAPRLRRWLKKHQRSPSAQQRVAQVREIVNRLEKLSGWVVVVEPTSKAVITIYRADSRRQRKFMQGGCRSVEGFHNDN